MKHIALALALLFTFCSPAVAQQVSNADAAQFRAIITGQMDAFQSGDGPRAYSFASPKIQQIFPDVGSFISMVQKGYPMVWRPKSVQFGKVTDELGSPTQRVIITDESGKLWTALYAFEQQPDGSWKINGVRIVEAASGEA